MDLCFTNDTIGFKQLIKLLNKSKHWCIMEANWTLFQKLAIFLHANEIELSVVNPLVIRRFCQMRLMKARIKRMLL